jgi:hypothetical protein
MTSEIGAPAASGADGPGGLLPGEIVLAVAELPVVWVCCDWPPPVCEQPATSIESVTSAAIRMPTG